ncbi:MAG: DMT family transporter [Bacteroidales bacterium]|nr:DMT family transporter [Bacteroidales bacterium]
MSLKNRVLHFINLSRKHPVVLTYIAMLGAMLFWGFSFIWTKKLLQFYEPFTILLLRLIISSLFLLVTGLALKKLQAIKLKDIRIIALLAFFEPFLYFIGEAYGLKYVSATASSVLIATIPLFSPVAAWFFFKDKLSILNFAGILISIIGIYLVILNENYELDASFIGILFMGLAVFSAIGYSVVVMNAAKRYNVFSIIFYQNLFGILFFLPFFFYFDFEHFIQVEITLEIIKPLMALAILASSVAFMLFTYGIRELGLVKANSISNIIPVFTAIFSYLVLDEILSGINIIGILIVLSGLFLTQLKRRMHLKNKIIPFIKTNGLKR